MGHRLSSWRPPDVVIEESGLESLKYLVDVDFGQFSGQCVVKAPSASAAKDAGRQFLWDEYIAELRPTYNSEAYVSIRPAAEDGDD